MKFADALEATRTSIRFVTDEKDLKRVCKSLEIFKADTSPFLTYNIDVKDTKLIEFASETVYVVSAVANKPTTSNVRAVHRAPGREVFRVNLMTLTSSKVSTYLHRPNEDYVLDRVGDTLADLFACHVIMPLMASAEKQGAVIKGSIDDAESLIEQARKRLGGSTTAIYNSGDFEFIAVSGNPGMPGYMETSGIAQNVMLVVRNDPAAVGLVNLYSDVVVAMGTQDVMDIRTVASISAGFAALGNAPIVKIDMR